jgi:peptide/nickel transport system ATP-binding protein
LASEIRFYEPRCPCPQPTAARFATLVTMTNKFDQAAKIVGDTLGTIEAAAAAVGTRVEQGFNEAVAVVSSSNTVERIEKGTAPARKAIAKNLAKAKKSAKKRVASATKKAGKAKKVAKKSAASATTRVSAAKKNAKKRVASATKKAGKAKKVAKKRATSAKRKTR